MRKFTPLATLFCCAELMAQTVIMNDSIALQEVTITSQARVEQAIDGDLYIPEKLQKQHSANGVELLKAMNYPGLEIDLLTKSISHTSGMVQLRINNVVSSINDLQSIDASLVKNIRFVTMPGLKYGKDVGLVINIRCKRGDIGTSAAITTMNALTTSYNDVGTWGKLTTQNSEWGLTYNFRQNSNEDVVTKTKQNYSDSSLPSNIDKEGRYNKCNFTSHNATLSYNFISSDTKHVFDIKLSGLHSGFPRRELIENTISDGSASTSITYNKSKENVPAVKLYYACDIDSVNSISAYWTGAYVSNKYDRGFVADDITSIYHVDGKKRTMHGELNYSRSLRNGTFDVGLHYDASTTKNEYTDNTLSSYAMHNDEQFLYAERQINNKRAQWKVGVGGNRQHFSNDGYSYTFWSIKPYLTFRFAFNDKLTMRYRFIRESYSPSLTDLTNYARRDDVYEVTVGNSELKPYNDNQNELRVGLDLGNTYFDLTTNYNIATNAIYTCNPTYDASQGVYLFTKTNGATKHKLKVELYAEQYLFERRLLVYAMPFIVRDIVDTEEYVHTNTNVALKTGMTLYMKAFAVNMGYGAPTETLSDNTLMHNYATSDLSVSYNSRRFSAKIGVRNLFASDGTGMKTTRLSSDAIEEFEQRNRAFGNMVYVGATWNIKQAKRQRRINVISTNADSDGGIVK